MKEFIRCVDISTFICGLWPFQFNHTSWMTVVTPTDRPKSVLSRCVIEAFGGVFVLSIVSRIFCWYRGFCHRTESDLLLFLFSKTSSICLYAVLQDFNTSRWNRQPSQEKNTPDIQGQFLGWTSVWRCANFVAFTIFFFKRLCLDLKSQDICTHLFRTN